MNRTIVSILVVIAVVFGGFFFYFSENTTISDRDMGGVREHNDNLASFEISPGDVVKKVRSNENVVLLDVRTLEEYEEVHLENAILLPVQEMSQQSLESIGLGEDAKDKEIIIYCRSGARSQTAYNIMKSLGYTNITSVAGGMIHWEEDGYPLTESGPYEGIEIPSSSTKLDISSEGPKISLNRTLHDFGVITQYGGAVETIFVVSNEGAQSLEIGDLTTSCGCTSAVISNSSIEPGGEATLTVIFDPDFHAEPPDVFKRTVFIPTNDPDTPEAEVAIQVDILEGE